MSPRIARRTVYYLGLLVATTVFFTLVYAYGMAAWEGRPRPLYRALEVVFQTYTTTGYGEDAPWETPQMNLLVIVMQLAGIGLILTAADVFAVPWLRDALAPSPPTEATDVTDHVIVCTFSARGEAFVEELDARGTPWVVIEPDADAALSLHEAGHRVVHGDPESTDALERAGIEAATAVVADAADDVNASIVLSAREANPDARVVTLLEDDSLEASHRLAGADHVLSPRQLLGESLARQVPSAVRTEVGEGVEIGDDLELVELSIDEGSDLCRRPIGETRLRERFAVDVVGAWIDGEFESPAPPTLELDPDTRLLVAGDPDRIADVHEVATPTVEPLSNGRVVIAGYGEAGRAAADALAGTETPVTVLDVVDDAGVDVVGDASDPDALREAGVEDAAAVIVTLDSDTTAIFATLIVRDLDPDVEILVRANDPESVPKLHRAGAAYVQSLATVSGRMLASTVLDDETVLAYESRIEVVELPVGSLAGRTLVDADVRSRTGATVLAVRRDGETITEFDPDAFAFDPDDAVVVAGMDESIRDFEEAFLDSA